VLAKIICSPFAKEEVMDYINDLIDNFEKEKKEASLKNQKEKKESKRNQEETEKVFRDITLLLIKPKLKEAGDKIFQKYPKKYYMKLHLHLDENCVFGPVEFELHTSKKFKISFELDAEKKSVTIYKKIFDDPRELLEQVPLEQVLLDEFSESHVDQNLEKFLRASFSI
jgi:hypothetical protein